MTISSVNVNEEQARESLRRRKQRMNSKRAEKIDTNDYSHRAETRFVRAIANDCSPLPEIVNPQRRAETERSLRLFAEYYFPLKFYLGWSTAQLDLINTVEDCVLNGGGTSANALPRGSGKTSLAETAAIWSLFHAHKRYALCLGAKGELGKNLFHSIRSEIEGNELLLEDFPEICYPFAFAERNPIKYRFQTYEGVPTQITYTAESLSLPNIQGSKTSGAYILCGSITASLRGLKRTTPKGENIRPDFVIIDDPQTDTSARSAAQTHQRERVIMGAIMGLAGPKNPITVVMPCTVIQQNDLADRFLDREAKPEWRGQRSKLLDSFPENMDLWSKYLEIKHNDFRAGGRGEPATEFYAENRAEMDKGAVVTWEDRFDPPMQISAIQYAMDLYFRDPIAFASEYQNQPLRESTGEGRPSVDLQASEIIKRVSGLPYGTVPRDTLFMTSGIDIQKDALYYLTVAWQADFSGVIADYGTCPEQPTGYYDTHNMSVPLSTKFPGLLQSPLTYKALEFLHEGPLAKQFKRDESDSTVGLDLSCVDANWNLTSDAVFQFCKLHSDKFWPCLGRGIGAAMLPMDQWNRKRGEIPNKANWRIRMATLGSNQGRHILYDTNFWKSRIGERLVAPLGSSNALKLYGSSVVKHQLLADHLASEVPIRTEGRGRQVDEWRTRASTSENHYFDCLILASIAASKLGLELLEVADNSVPDDTREVAEGIAGLAGQKEYKAAPIQTRARKVAAPPPRRNENV